MTTNKKPKIFRNIKEFKAIDASTDDTTLKGIHIPRLKDASNFSAWLLAFRRAATRNGTWPLFTGAVPMAVGPKTPSPQIAAAFEKPWEKRANDDDFELALAKYQCEYDKYSHAVDHQALADYLLTNTIEEDLIEEISEACNTPKEQLDFVTRKFAIHARMHAYSQIEDIQLAKCKSMEEYIQELKQVRSEIVVAGGVYRDDQIIAKIARSLTCQYNDFVGENLICISKIPKLEDVFQGLLQLESSFRNKPKNRIQQQKLYALGVCIDRP